MVLTTHGKFTQEKYLNDIWFKRNIEGYSALLNTKCNVWIILKYQVATIAQMIIVYYHCCQVTHPHTVA